MCVGCGRAISEPGLARTGSVLGGTTFRTVIEGGWTSENEWIKTYYRVGYPSYVKGYLCVYEVDGKIRGCGTCYLHVPLGPGGTDIPLVKVDALYGLPKPRDQREGKANNRGFNTRVTRSRRLSR